MKRIPSWIYIFVILALPFLLKHVTGSKISALIFLAILALIQVFLTNRAMRGPEGNKRNSQSGKENRVQSEERGYIRPGKKEPLQPEEQEYVRPGRMRSPQQENVTQNKQVAATVIAYLVAFFSLIGYDPLVRFIESPFSLFSHKTEKAVEEVIENPSPTVENVGTVGTSNVTVSVTTESNSTVNVNVNAVSGEAVSVPTPYLINGPTYFGHEIWGNILATRKKLEIGSRNNYIISTDMNKICRRFEIQKNCILDLTFSYFYDQARTKNAVEREYVADDWQISIVKGNEVLYSDTIDNSEDRKDLNYSLSSGEYIIVVQRTSRNTEHWYISLDAKVE